MTAEPTALTGRERAIAAFEERFGRRPTHLTRAPGRVNLIGEHTDYNDGFVLPMALDRSTYLALAPREDDTVRLLAADLGEEGGFPLHGLATIDVSRRRQAGSRASWLDYPQGVAWSLALEGKELRGFDGVVASDVPRGAGLSSSAALELAVAAAFLFEAFLLPESSEVSPDPATTAGWDLRWIAKAMQRTENEWIGVNSGIMDQLICAAALKGHATLIDCQNLDLRAVGLPTGVRVVVLDTGTRRGLVDSAYNERRAACERVARALGVTALRGVTAREIERAEELDPIDHRRALHVVEENARTLAAAAALERSDVREAGALMRRSHASLRDLFEVSSAALDAIVAAAEAAPGCLGARMTGAGFGGCAVALVEEAACDEFLADAATRYQAATGLQATLYPTTAGSGAGAERLSPASAPRMVR